MPWNEAQRIQGGPSLRKEELQRSAENSHFCLVAGVVAAAARAREAVRRSCDVPSAPERFGHFFSALLPPCAFYKQTHRETKTQKESDSKFCELVENIIFFPLTWFDFVLKM